MKKYLILPATVCIMTFIISSCYKNDPEYDVSITFLEPDAGASFASGDTVHMEIDFEGTQTINNIRVLAINSTAGDTLADYIETTNDDFLFFHEHILPIVAVNSDIKIIASAWESSESDAIINEVDVTVHP